MTASHEIPYVEFIKLLEHLDLQITGDGRDENGTRFWIRRYKSRVTGKIYDCIQGIGPSGEPRCIEITMDSADDQPKTK